MKTRCRASLVYHSLSGPSIHSGSLVPGAYHVWVEAKLPWISETSEVQIQNGELKEKEDLKNEYQMDRTEKKNLMEMKTMWKEDDEILDMDSEDFAQEDIRIIKECERLGVLLETQKVRVLETAEEYFRKAGVRI